MLTTWQKFCCHENNVMNVKKVYNLKVKNEGHMVDIVNLAGVKWRSSHRNFRYAVYVIAAQMVGFRSHMVRGHGWI